MNTVAIIVGDIYKTGGTERATSNLANIISSLDYNVIIISISGNDQQKCNYNLNNKIIVKNLELTGVPLSFLKKPFWYFLLIKKLRKVFKQHQFNIIIGTGHGISSLLPIVNQNTGSQIIACEHIAYNSIPLVSRIFRNIMYHFIDSVVVLTKSAEKKYPFVKIVRRIPNSLSFSPETIAELNAKQILAVGRLSKVKGFDRLIIIAELLKKHNPDWRIKIVGEGELVKPLKEASLGLNIEFSPFTSNIQEEYLSSSIYVLTSYSEAFPMVFLEAKACGLPIVSFNCPEGPADIIFNNIDGFLIDDGNYELFYEKLSLLIESYELRKLMGLNARKDSCNYRQEIISDLWKDLFNDLKNQKLKSNVIHS